MGDNQILKGIKKGFGELGSETIEKTAEHVEKIFESVITGKELLGMEKTMSDNELEFQKKQEEQKKNDEIKKIKGEMGQYGDEVKDKRRDVEGEIEELRRKQEKEEEEKEAYFAKMEEQKRRQEQQQAEEYNYLNMESTNPAKQKKSRGSALAHKKKQQPDQSQMSQTAEFKGKLD